MRVPAIVISAHTPKGVIDHTIFDHTSILATVERLYGLDNLTKRDKAAQDLRHLIALQDARTDTPAALTAAANVDPQLALSCEEDDETTQDRLMAQRAELRIAQRTGIYRDRRAEAYGIPATQYGFLAVALRRALENAEYPDRKQWIEDFNKINNGVDAALFMTEAKLKARYGIDMKKVVRQGTEQKDNEGTPVARLNLM